MAGTLRPSTLRIVLGDQCSAGLSALSDLDPARDVVLMSEIMGVVSRRRASVMLYER